VNIAMYLGVAMVYELLPNYAGKPWKTFSCHRPTLFAGGCTGLELPDREAWTRSSAIAVNSCVRLRRVQHATAVPELAHRFCARSTPQFPTLVGWEPFTTRRIALQI
jgi:hypothetical protein